jgi:uncharacterized membrane protein
MEEGVVFSHRNGFVTGRKGRINAEETPGKVIYERKGGIKLSFDTSDIEKNKAMAIVAYILFFVPLLAARESRFAMYHTNQGLLVFLGALAVNIVGGIIPFIGPLIIAPIGNLCVLVLMILGIINAANGKQAPLPFIGHIQIIK